MKPVNSSDGIDKSNLVKVHEDQFIDEFLHKVVCSNANCEIVDKEGNTKGYITEKELSKALTKEHMSSDAVKSVQ
jgi:glycine betaine/proline transport system ATP-binding protein